MSAFDVWLNQVRAVCACFLLIGLAGCGRIGPQPVPVSGDVTLNGTPLPYARVVFHPQEITGRTAVTKTNANGQYVIREGNDEISGLPPGQYTVVVTYYTTADGQSYNPDEGFNRMLRQRKLTQVLPENYSSEKETELSILVAEATDEKVTNVFRLAMAGPKVRLPGGTMTADPFEDREWRPPAGALTAIETGGSAITDVLLTVAAVVTAVAILALAFIVIVRRRVAAMPFDYEGEMELALQPAPASAEVAPVAPPREMPRRRRPRPGTAADQEAPPKGPKKKRRRKKARPRAEQGKAQPDGKAAAGEASREDLAAVSLSDTPAEREAAMTNSDSSRAPAIEIDAGLDDEDVAAAYLLGEELPTIAKAPPQKQKPPSDDHQADQSQLDGEMAKWVLARGGFVKIQIGQENPQNVKDASDLPANSFRLHGIFFEGNENLDDKLLEQLKELPKLDTLDLASTKVSDDGLRELKRLPGLRTLALSRTAVSDAGLQQLEALSGLRVLLLYRTKVTDAGIEHLKKLKHLKTVELKRTDVTEAGVEDLKKSLPYCKVII